MGLHGTAGVPPALPRPSGRKAPIRCFLTEPSLDRVLFDVEACRGVMRVIAHVSVEVLWCPKRTAPLQVLICLLRGEGFPGMHNAAEGLPVTRLDQRMDVIRHHAPPEKR